jgi:hypothetical protein
VHGDVAAAAVAAGERVGCGVHVAYRPAAGSEHTQADLRDIFERVGYLRITSHTFRRTVGTLMDEAGLSAILPRSPVVIFFRETESVPALPRAGWAARRPKVSRRPGLAAGAQRPLIS